MSYDKAVKSLGPGELLHIEADEPNHVLCRSIGSNEGVRISQRDFVEAWANGGIIPVFCRVCYAAAVRRLGRKPT